MKPLVGPSSDSVGYRATIPSAKRRSPVIRSQKSHAQFDHTAKLEHFSSEIDQLANIQRQLPATMSATLLVHMERTGITEEALAEKAQVSPKTISRMRNEQHVSIESFIAVCIGLQLHPILSSDMIGKSDHRFSPGNTAHVAYQILLFEHYRSSIFECNEWLISQGFKPLGGKSDE